MVDRGEVDLEVWFDDMRLSDRSWELDPQRWKFRWRLLGGRVPGSLGGAPIRELALTRPDVLICNYDRLNMVLGATAARVTAGRVAIRALPAYPAQSPMTWRKRLAWSYLFRIVDGAKVPGPDGRDFCAQHGLPQDRCWRVTQSVDVRLFESGTASIDARPPLLRFVVVTRMIRSKGVDELLAAWRSVRSELSGCSLVLVGDGSDEQRLRASSADMPEVEWLGFRQPQDLPDVYAAADVLVFPTLGDPNGLVVEEAMAAGLPIISTDAAGDIRRRVPQGEAGWVVPAGDVDALGATLRQVAATPRDELVRMGRANVERAQRFLPEAYAADFSGFVLGLRASGRRRNLWTLLAGAIGRVLVSVTAPAARR